MKHFIKYGITSRSVKQRYSSSELMPYNYEVTQEIYSDPDHIYDLEIQLKKILKQFKYTPIIYFKGSKTECFNILFV